MISVGRLILTAAIGLVGIIGLTITLYVLLPGEADEAMRRLSEVRLEQAARQLPQEILSDAAILSSRLQMASQAQELADFGPEEIPSTEQLARGLKIAEQICRKYGLPALSIIDGRGILRSVWPNAARLGMEDQNLLKLAKSATKGVTFASVVDSDNNTYTLSIVSSASILNDLWLVVASEVERKTIDAFAAKYGAIVSDAVFGTHEKLQLEEGARLVVLEDYEGNQAAAIVLRMDARGRDIMSRLIQRRLLLVAIPWCLFFGFLILLVGWPRIKKTHS